MEADYRRDDIILDKIVESRSLAFLTPRRDMTAGSSYAHIFWALKISQRITTRDGLNQLNRDKKDRLRKIKKHTSKTDAQKQILTIVPAIPSRIADMLH